PRAARSASAARSSGSGSDPAFSCGCACCGRRPPSSPRGARNPQPSPPRSSRWRPRDVGGAMTATMRAGVYTGDKRVAPSDVPRPELGAADVLVDVSHCGVCGTDVHMITYGWAQPGRIGGHEWSGIVREVGPGVTRWQAGDRVVGGPTWCG